MVAQMPELGNTNKLSQSGLAYRQLERLIVTLKLKPGQSLTEAALIDLAGLGRTPVREAVQKLEWEGLVFVRPRSGIEISALDPSDFPKILAVRKGVEMLMAWGAASYALPEHDDMFEEMRSQMQAALDANDIEAFLDADKAFDIVLGEACANPYAVRLAAPLQTHSRRFWYRLRREAGLQSAVNHHLAIIEAIIRRDPDAAESAAERLIGHLQH
jgi:DNA-binding GntR family transcriptional regulator